MSTFSGLSSALSAMQAQRRALDVGGQNVANAGTAGYTRQRADLQALGPGSPYSLQGTPRTVGDGVQVAAIVRLSDEFAMARLRGAEADASFLNARKAVLTQVETRFAEPGDTGLTAQLSELWATWGDVANHPEDLAARGVMLEQARAVADQVSAGYNGVTNQWLQVREQTSALVTQVNTTASAVADLNHQIKAAVAVGAPANELVDERDRMVVDLAKLTGATTRTKDDGTVDVLLSGTALVRGDRTNRLAMEAPATLEGVASTPVTFTWADGTPAVVTTGELGAGKQALGTDLVAAAAGYDDVATKLMDSVNALHTQGRGLDDPDAAAGRELFQYVGPGKVVVNPGMTARDVAAGAPGQGQFDGTFAVRISALGTAADGPNKAWEAFVVATGVDTQAATRRAATADVVRLDAEAAWTSATSVDVDEEMVNMLTTQRAYEGAARMLTAVDQALDTLINRTGLVGR
ncbi:flagellar hook-associated protein FlgK [Thalassiella azotivora]